MCVAKTAREWRPSRASGRQVKARGTLQCGVIGSSPNFSLPDSQGVMRGMDADAPTHPFGGTEELAISPDGKEVLFAAKDEGKADAWTTNIDVFEIAAIQLKALARFGQTQPVGRAVKQLHTKFFFQR